MFLLADLAHAPALGRFAHDLFAGARVPPASRHGIHLREGRHAQAEITEAGAPTELDRRRCVLQRLEAELLSLHVKETPDHTCALAQELEVGLVVLKQIRMNLPCRRHVRLQSRLACEPARDVAVRHVLERPHDATARQAMQSIERSNRQAVRLCAELGLNLDDLSVEDGTRLGALRSRARRNLNGLARCEERIVDPPQRGVVQHDRRHVRHVQAVLDDDVGERSHELLGDEGAVDLQETLADEGADLRHSVSPESYLARDDAPGSTRSHPQSDATR